ncbi:MAG: AmmeMemoRadiSam system protein B [Candidatus Eisenbacteria bacterium]|nr:AmmeMemoRadiSam system protein B [Candidatus Eisenbacteria bacterium]
MADLIQIQDPGESGTLRPLLRPLEVTAVQDQGRDLLVLADPLHVVEDAVVLPVEYLPLLELLDGSRTVEQLAAFVLKETGDLQVGGLLRQLVGRLDELLLLDSPRFQDAWRRLQREYRGLPVRAAALAGISYPEEPAELRAHLAGLREEALKFRPAEADHAPADALVSPHIDPRRGGPAMALAYLSWEDAAPRLIVPGGDHREPDVVAAFGTGHAVLGSLVVPTRKDFETPLGTVPTCVPVVDALAAEFGDEVFAEEIAHRDEHSLEFQALFLASLMERGARFEMVPLLCGPFSGFLEAGRRPSDDEVVNHFVDTLRGALKATGRRVRFLAGVDLSHVGMRFGDDWKPTEDNLVRLEESDRALVDAALTGDAEQWFDAVARERNRTQVCGFSAIYLMLRVMGGGRGRLLRYEQSPEEDSASVVTYAAIAFEADGRA